MKQTKQTLWTAGFSRTTIATILNAIGGEAMNLPISLLVFDQTGSTLLSSLVLVCGILPDVLLPLLAAPFVDRGRKKTWIVGLDSATALFYLAMGLFVSRHAFHYPLYLAFVLIIGSISACCRLAYQAWYPSLIPAGLEQKGYAVSNTIYPFIAIAMSPFAAFLYKESSMAQIYGAFRFGRAWYPGSADKGMRTGLRRRDGNPYTSLLPDDARTDRHDVRLFTKC